MKILHVISGLTTGGAERMLEKLIPEMRRLGVDSEVVCLGPAGPIAARLRDAGVPVHFLRPPGSVDRDLFFVRRLFALARVVKHTRPAAILGWMHPGNLAATVAWLLVGRGFPFRRRHPSLFWSVHQSLHSLAYEKRATAVVIRLNALISRLPQGIVYVSRRSAAQHAARGFDPRHATVIPIGFDTEVYAPLSGEEKKRERERLGLEPDAFWAGLIARDDPKKDAVNFVAAAAKLATAYQNARFLLLGAGMDHPRSPARLAARRLDVEARFLFHGETEQPREWIASLDVLVSASYTEAFPNVIGEAMACEVPCVVTDVGDCAYLLGDAGLVVPPRDAEALAAGLRALIEAGPQERARLGRFGRERVRSEFSLRGIAERYVSLFGNGMRE